MAANPGGHRDQGPVDALDEPLESTEEIASRAAIRSFFDGPTLSRFVDEPQGQPLIGIFDHEVRQWLGAETRLVCLPEQIMHKQKGHWAKRRMGGYLQYEGHSLTLAEYRLLPGLIERPQVVMRYMPMRALTREGLGLRLNLLSEVDGNYYNIVLGRFPDDPAKVGLISFHRIEDGWPRVERMIRRARTKRDGQDLFRNFLPEPHGRGTAPGSPVGPPGGLRIPPPGTRPGP